MVRGTGDSVCEDALASWSEAFLSLGSLETTSELLIMLASKRSLVGPNFDNKLEWISTGPQNLHLVRFSEDSSAHRTARTLRMRDAFLSSSDSK
jgi:hypothetical protein